jgi:hypothetical protein
VITNRKTPNPTQKYINIHGGNTIMLLQELSRDTRTLLNNTHATREQLETFLKVSGLDLGDILYRQSKYNLFVEWLEAEKPQELLFVNYSMIEYLVNKYDKGQKYSKGEMLDCYAFDTKTEKYIVCINSNGDCYIYQYDSINELREDFI